MGSFKAIALRDQLAADLAVRLSALAGVKSFGSSSDPLLTLGTVGTGNQQCLIRVKQLTAVGTDVLGLTQTVFTPHVIQVDSEATAAAATVSRLTMANMAAILGAATALGARVEFWLSDSGQSVLETAFAGTNASLVATFNLRPEYPLAGQ